MIYVVQAVDGGPLKIGFSDNVPARVKQLESHYRRPLAVLATIPGGREEERAIHERFSHLRFGKTEQFRPDPDLLAFIGRPLFVNAIPVIEAMNVRSTARDALIAVKCWAAYKHWVEEFAEMERITPSSLIDIAIMEWAKVRGFKAPPKR